MTTGSLTSIRVCVCMREDRLKPEY